MPSQSLLGKLLRKRRAGNSNSPERTPSKQIRTSAKVVSFRLEGKDKVQTSAVPTAWGLPGQVAEDTDFVGNENTPRLEIPTLLEDEGMHLRWEEVLAGRHVSKLSSEELRQLGEAGMPLKHRHALWPEWFTAPNVNNIEQLQGDVPEDVAAQIDADVARTQPKFLGAAERATLRRVLRAYAAGNLADGYCQGMNNIAAVFILLGFDEATTLRGCYTMLQGVCPGYHDRDLAGFRLDAQVLGELARRLLPAETCERLEALDVPLEVLISEHFLTLASRSWPLHATARLWDIILQEGSPAVFASFLALLQLYLPNEKDLYQENKLASDYEADEPVDIFRSRVSQGVSTDLETILRKVRTLIPLIPQNTINQLRFEFAGKKH